MVQFTLNDHVQFTLDDHVQFTLDDHVQFTLDDHATAWGVVCMHQVQSFRFFLALLLLITSQNLTAHTKTKIHRCSIISSFEHNSPIVLPIDLP